MDRALGLPLFFRPQFKERIWGGSNLQKYFSPEVKLPPRCGESWLISSVNSSVSEVSSGPYEGRSLNEIIEVLKGQLMGESIYSEYGSICPLLLKLIDAAEDLSVQVHPNDEIASRCHESLGKTEAWYIIKTSPSAGVLSGFNEPMSKSSYLAHLQAGTLLEALHTEVATQGDVFFMPAGRIHSTGGGILLAEIQQCSDVTYRIYDFDRVEASGQARSLHIEESLEALDFGPTRQAKTAYTDSLNRAVPLLMDAPFVLHKLHCKKGGVSRDMSQVDSFVTYLCVSGEAEWRGEAGSVHLKAGDCVLVPAVLTEYELSSRREAVLLEAYMRG